MEVSPVTYGDIIITLIAIGFSFITYKLWQERNDSPKKEQKGSRILLVIIALLFAGISIGLLILAVNKILDPMHYSIEEYSNNTKMLGNVHNWAWSLLFFGGSIMIGYLTTMFFRIWKIWKEARDKKETKQASKNKHHLKELTIIYVF